MVIFENVNYKVVIFAAKPVWRPPLYSITGWQRREQEATEAEVWTENGRKKLLETRLPRFQAVNGDTTSTRSAISSAKLDLNRAARIVTATIKSRVKGAAMLTRKRCPPCEGHDGKWSVLLRGEPSGTSKIKNKY